MKFVIITCKISVSIFASILQRVNHKTQEYVWLKKGKKREGMHPSTLVSESPRLLIVFIPIETETGSQRQTLEDIQK